MYPRIMRKDETVMKDEHLLQGLVPEDVWDAVEESQQRGMAKGRIVKALGHLWKLMTPETQQRLYMSMIDRADPKDKLVVELMQAVDEAIVGSLLAQLPGSARLVAQYAESSASEKGKRRKPSRRKPGSRKSAE